jgi:hypothetical protein
MSFNPNIIDLTHDDDLVVIDLTHDDDDPVVIDDDPVVIDLTHDDDDEEAFDIVAEWALALIFWFYIYPEQEQE